LYSYLQHPALLRYFGSLTLGGKRVLVREFMAGRSLYDVVADAREAAAATHKAQAGGDAHGVSVVPGATDGSTSVTCAPVVVSAPCQEAPTTTALEAHYGQARLPAAFAACVLRDVASALVFLHERQHAHGDVHKSNVLLEMNPDAWLSAQGALAASERPLVRLGDLGTVRDLRIPGDFDGIYMPVPGVPAWPRMEVFADPAI